MKSKIDKVIESINYLKEPHEAMPKGQVLNILEQLRPYVELGEISYNDFNIINNSCGYDVAKIGYNQIQLNLIQQIKEQKQ